MPQRIMLQFMPISKSTDIDLNAHEDSSNLDNSGSTTKTSGHEIVNISKVPNNGNEHSEYEVNGVNGLSILEHSSPEPKRKTTTYQERVSYIPNHDFTGNKSSILKVLLNHLFQIHSNINHILMPRRKH